MIDMHKRRIYVRSRSPKLLIGQYGFLQRWQNQPDHNFEEEML